jgi:hypothetical protein
MKPCYKEHPQAMKPGTEFVPGKDCRLCWLDANDPDYFAESPAEPQQVVQAAPARIQRCLHLGRRCRDKENKIKTRWCITG